MAPRPYLGFDGNNTYVCLRNTDYALTFKAWRFRTDITSAAPPALAKSTSSHGPLPMMTFGPAGDYRVSLQPAGGGKTSLQMFDLLGRCIFTKTIDDLTRPVSFTVPAGNVPRTPFVARVRDENGASMQREIPVR